MATNFPVIREDFAESQYNMALRCLAAIWRGLLHAGFLLLCLRFQIAAVREASPDVWPTLALIAGGLGLGAWNPRAALFAFTLAVPLLSGLGQTTLLNCATPPGLVFPAMFLGISLRWFAKCRSLFLSRRSLAKADARAAAAELAGDENRGGAAFAPPEPEAAPLRNRLQAGSYIITDVLITVFLSSLVMQIIRHSDAPGFWSKFLSQPVFGYGDPFYFLTSAFLWLQGLFYFRMLVSMKPSPIAHPGGPGSARAAADAAAFATASASPSLLASSELAERRREVGPPSQTMRGFESACVDGAAQGAKREAVPSENLAVATWLRPMFVACGVTMAFFFLFQFISHVPEGWTSAGAGFQSPYEDISSFGSIAVAVFIFFVASVRKGTWPAMVLNAVGIIGLLMLAVASWSRGAWLAGMVVLLVIAWLRLPKKWTVGCVTIGILFVAAVNLNADRESWQSNRYLWRLVTLVRLENPANKSPSRINLWRKALGMIRDHPLAGHGIGSFYLTSRNYARTAGDPYAEVPDFAHNFLLEIAAELGVPIAALFAALIGAAFLSSHRAVRPRKEEQGARSRSAELQSGGATERRNDDPAELRGDGPTAGRCDRDFGKTAGWPDDRECVMLGATMALGAYLLTQMTANSLNVYVSNQFFFWFLMAASFQPRRSGGTGN